jgi:hypothetical protein
MGSGKVAGLAASRAGEHPQTNNHPTRVTSSESRTSRDRNKPHPSRSSPETVSDTFDMTDRIARHYMRVADWAEGKTVPDQDPSQTNIHYTRSAYSHARSCSRAVSARDPVLATYPR